MSWFKGLSLTWKIVGLVAALALTVWAFTFVRGLFVGDLDTQAKLGTEQADAAIESGTDAVETIGNAGKRDDTIDGKVKGIDNAIDQADDAGAADADLRERLCSEFGACD